MSFAIIIPARFQSSRFPGKPLAQLRGAGGTVKTLLHRSFEAALPFKNQADIYIATDDERIRAEAETIGADVLMTSTQCRNGTERVWDAVQNLKQDYDFFINLQGDAPLTPPDFITALIKEMQINPQTQVATPCLPCDLTAYQRFIDDRRQGRVGGTTMVFDQNHNALYFSKEVIPYTDQSFNPDDAIPVFHHVGLYAYRATALERFCNWSPGPLETLEGLEQLRFLENGVQIKVCKVLVQGRDFWEVNNPHDIERVEQALTALGIE